MAKPIMLWQGWSGRVFASRHYTTRDGVNFRCTGQKDDVTMSFGYIAATAMTQDTAVANALARYRDDLGDAHGDIDAMESAMRDAILTAANTAFPGVVREEE